MLQEYILLDATINVFGYPPLTVLKLLTSAFLAILFLQSGLDKVFDYKGNLAYFTDHFKNSILAPTVGLLMPVITILEVASGIFSAVGVITLLSGNEIFAYTGILLSALSIISLFFGQRLAKDYGGAATLVPYFILTIVGMLLYYF